MVRKSQEELVRDALFSTEENSLFTIKEELQPRQLIAPREHISTFPFDEIACQGCKQITTLRECWGCKKWFCYDCLIEHMIGCPEWQKIKGYYAAVFECDKHETCDNCPYRFKCYTNKKVPKKKKK